MAKKARSEKQKANDARLAAMGKAKAVKTAALQTVSFMSKGKKKTIQVKRAKETCRGNYCFKAPRAVDLTQSGVRAVCADYCKTIQKRV